MRKVSSGNMRCLQLLLLSGMFSAVWADELQHEHREHGVHEHGVAQLNIALEGDVLQMELETPTMNIVGFEHMPATRQQQQEVDDAAATLRHGAEVFSLPAAAGCVLQEANVESALLKREHDDMSHEHEHRHEGHADFDADYSFKCVNPMALKYVDVQLFTLFSGMREIDVQIITHSGQRAQELNSQSVRINIQ